MESPLFDPHDSRDLKLIEHRRNALVHAGMPGLSARILATRRDIDYRDGVRLLERGCPPHLVLEILE